MRRVPSRPPPRAVSRFARGVLLSTAVTWPASTVAERFLDFELLAVADEGRPSLQWLLAAVLALLVTATTIVCTALPVEWLVERSPLPRAARTSTAVIAAAVLAIALFARITPWPLSVTELGVLLLLSVIMVTTFRFGRALSWKPWP